ncbi:MAG TPA: rod shape-determining protein RodA, partial [Saprospiraceae bacterium]|nr:rod shape-determining protein RodA [Saprospiraceae bacterium]
SVLAAVAILGFKQYWIALGLGLTGFLVAGFLHLARYNARLAGMLTAVLVVGSGLAFSTDYAFNNIMKPHQQDRINVWLHPERCDPRGSLYNVLQSKMAIASGGLEGKGFLEGAMTKMNYVPEQSTDFIFCTVGEEQGFIGSMTVIVLFLAFLLRLIFIAERQRSPFSRHFAYGVAGLLFVHFFVNIGMTMGLLPIIGIPLPLISKGGSSLLGFTIMIGILLKLDSNRYSL